MQTSNPALSDNSFTRLGYGSQSETMTMQGTVMKTLILLMLTVLSAAWIWMKFNKAGAHDVAMGAISPWMIGGAIAGLVLSLATIFKPVWAPMTAPAYAVMEGLFLGGVSAVTEAAYPGIVVQATLLTFGTLFAMLFAYQSGLIKATDGFKRGIVAATGGIFLVYMVTWILSFFHINVPFMTGSGLMSIGFSLFVVAIAALNFVLDFDYIEQASRKGVAKYMEWYGAFAMMVTLVWLYVEFLRLLSKLRDR